MHAKPPHKVLIAAIILTFSYAIVEGIGGWWSGSLALLGDAGHMASDALALTISAFAAWIAIKPPSDSHTYGLGRAEVIAAWISSLLMVILSIAIIVEAVARFQQPQIVKGGSVMIIAFIGMLINIYIAWLLSRSEQTLNIRAAMLHVLADLLGTVTALISGAVIYFTGWVDIDPILSIVISLLIMFSSVQLLRESFTVLMEGTPRHIEVSTVKKSLCETDNVYAIHDLHIWTLSSGTIVLTAHVVMLDMSHWQKTLNTIGKVLRDRFHIEHITIQPEDYHQMDMEQHHNECQLSHAKSKR